MKGNMQQFTDLASKIAAQDNRATKYPLFIVYDYDEIIVDGEFFSGDETKWLYCAEEPEDRGLYNDEEKEIKIKELMDEASLEYPEDDIPDSIFYRDQYEEMFTRVEVLKVEKFVNVFFTNEAAQNFIDANRYHYKEPHIYVDSAWRNEEVKQLIHSIFELSGTTPPHFWE
jgi:hypothetical protein